MKEVSDIRRCYLITGANGHLGHTLIRALAQTDCEVRGLLLPGEAGLPYAHVTYYRGDVRDASTLLPLFSGIDPANTVLIHTAGIVSIAPHVSPQLYEVNVTGTRHVAQLCLSHGVRMVYVSSVHAIPEQHGRRVLCEVSHFSPDDVIGGYARTKAEATQVVLDAVTHGLDAVVVHPSGILGPYDTAGGNHLMQMLEDYLRGRLPACVRGGYDLVDVRDVAQGCLLAAHKGRKGECYILSNRYYTIRHVLAMAREAGGGRRLPVLPLWVARAAVPLLSLWARMCKKRPLYTAYSLYALATRDRFSHDKATSELGYCPRDLRDTIDDTVAWLQTRASAARCTATVAP